MFTLITGTPGAGKTAYTVWEVIRPMLGQTLTDAKGETHQRRILTNIKGLTLPHELIDADNLKTWPDWCKPGDLIVFDEVQEVWRPRSLGSTVPPAVAAIETHRHKGIDLVVITQHPGLLDSNVRKLVNQHVHLRRLTDSYAYRYEWDSCSDNVKSTKACVHAGMWRRPKAVHALYTSAMAHTKTKSRLPALAYLLPVALVAFLGIGGVAYSRITERFDTDSIAQKAPEAKPAQAESLILQEPGQQQAEGDQSTPEEPAQVVDLGPPAQAQTQFVGCIAAADRCACFDQTGAKVEPDIGLCAGLMEPTGTVLDLIPDPPDLARAAHDGRVLASML